MLEYTRAEMTVFLQYILGGDPMFLTKKSFLKIIIMAIFYFVLGSIDISLWFVFKSMGISENFLLILGIIVYLLCILLIVWGCYAEGKGKLIHMGNKLVRNELKPAEFLLYYEALNQSNDLIIKKPSIEVLQLVAIAYDSLDDRENALATVDEMIDIAYDKKKTFLNLFKCALLFSYGRVEEAEGIFNQIQKQKLDVMCNGLVDAILKNDRAKAMEDYKTVEAYNLKLLDRSFPKLDNLSKLVIHYQLGEVYEELQEFSKAILHYQYCKDFGGETAMRKTAIEKLDDITF